MLERRWLKRIMGWMGWDEMIYRFQKKGKRLKAVLASLGRGTSPLLLRLWQSFPLSLSFLPTLPTEYSFSPLASPGFII